MISTPLPEKDMKKFAILAMLFSTLMLAGCNTVSGFGKDVQKVGDKVEGAAEDCGDANGC